MFACIAKSSGGYTSSTTYPVKVNTDAIKNGTVTVTPDEGYELDDP